MRLTPFLSLSLLIAAALAGCSGSDRDATAPAPVDLATTPGFTFDVTTVDTQYGVGEPSILVDPAGTLWIAGPTGFVSPIVERDPTAYTYDSGLFKSTDQGVSWLNVQQIPTYGRDTCPGGGDSDIASSPDGALFLIDLNLVNVPIDVSTDGGETWLFNCNSSVIPGLDRQWVAASDDYVWISVNHLALGPIVYRSDRLGTPLDGLVFGAPVQVPNGGAIVVDQNDGTLYLAGSGAQVDVSTDDGQTWTAYATGLADVDLSGSFISIALDAAGNAFVAGSGSDGVVVSGSSDKGKTWTPAARFKPYGAGDEFGNAEYGFAWVAAGGDGTVGFAWYGRTFENETGEWKSPEKGYYLFAGQSQDVLEKGANATALYARVSEDPVATKNLCVGINLVGLVPCDQADPSATRALGDFFEVAFDNDGYLVIAFVDGSDQGNDLKPTHLMFAKQTTGFAAPPMAYGR